MKKIIETQRLILRPFKKEDASSFYQNVQSDFLTMMYLDQDPAESEDETKEYIEERLPYYDEKHFYDWIIIKKSSSSAIGEINASWNKQYQTADIGYAIGSNYWNQHYATEALKALIFFFFYETDCQKIIGACSQDNPASMQVMMNGGMLPDHHLPQELQKMESFETPVYFSLSKRKVLENEYELACKM